MILISANNASTQLGANISSGTTTIPLATGTGALFPSPAAGQFFTLTLNDALTGNVYEICYCTSRTADNCTVLRGQEGTSARAWLIGDFAYNALTARNIAKLTNVGMIKVSGTGGTITGTSGSMSFPYAVTVIVNVMAGTATGNIGIMSFALPGGTVSLSDQHDAGGSIGDLLMGMMQGAVPANTSFQISIAVTQVSSGQSIAVSYTYVIAPS